MNGRHMALASTVGVLSAILIGFAPTLIPAPIVQYVLAPALDYWFVGVALVAVAFVLRNGPGRRGVVRAIGLVGAWWVAFAIGFYVLLVIVFVFLNPIGY
jgi:hypothetical protein